jgi:hypothetical protein
MLIAFINYRGLSLLKEWLDSSDVDVMKRVSE